MAASRLLMTLNALCKLPLRNEITFQKNSSMNDGLMSRTFQNENQIQMSR